MIGDLISYLNPLRTYELYFRQKENAFDYHTFLQWGFYA
jgi:hypothetical protein